MNNHPHSGVTSWILALILPVLTAGIAYLWLNATSPSVCIHGPGSPSFGGLVGLVLAATAFIGWYAHRTTRSVLSAGTQILISLTLGLPLVWIAEFVWAAAHLCFD